jgi:hypothetical protein
MQSIQNIWDIPAAEGNTELALLRNIAPGVTAARRLP